MNRVFLLGMVKSEKEDTTSLRFDRSLRRVRLGAAWQIRVVNAPLTPMTTTYHPFRAYVAAGSVDKHLYRTSISITIAYSHLT